MTYESDSTATEWVEKALKKVRDNLRLFGDSLDNLFRRLEALEIEVKEIKQELKRRNE